MAATPKVARCNYSHVSVINHAFAASNEPILFSNFTVYVSVMYSNIRFSEVYVHMQMVTNEMSNRVSA